MLMKSSSGLKSVNEVLNEEEEDKDEGKTVDEAEQFIKDFERSIIDL